MHRRGFTLFEICLALGIALMLISMAVPSLQSFLNNQEQKKSFERFDALVRQAQSLAVSERRSYLMIWEKSGIVLRPEQPASKVEAKGKNSLQLGKNETCTIDFPAALMKKPVSKWIFWPSGTCETAVITFTGNGTAWEAEYDPLTVRATVSDHEKK